MGAETANDDPSEARLLRFKGGNTVRASASAIAFLWANWDVLYQVLPKFFPTARLTSNGWRGRALSGRGDWYLMESIVGIDEGRFEYYSTIQFAGREIRGTSVFEYHRVSGEQIAYHGQSWGELPGWLGLVRPVVRLLGDRATHYFNECGGEAAELITRSPMLVKERADPEAYDEFMAMSVEEAALLSGSDVDARFFKLSDRIANIKRSKDPLDRLRQDINDLESRLAAENRSANLREYVTCIDIFPKSPDMAVAKTRKIMESILIRIHRSEIGGSDKAADKRIGELKDRNIVPNSIVALMRTINNIGNVAVHPSEGKVPSRIDLAQFKTTFAASIGLADWYYQSRYSRSGKIG